MAIIITLEVLLALLLIQQQREHNKVMRENGTSTHGGTLAFIRLCQAGTLAVMAILPLITG